MFRHRPLSQSSLFTKHSLMSGRRREIDSVRTAPDVKAYFFIQISTAYKVDDACIFVSVPIVSTIAMLRHELD